jgi:hypothetical protein
MNADFATAARSNGSRAKTLAFCCLRCQTHPAWYRRGRLIVMSCPCGAVALDYDKLPVIPQNEHEWYALLCEWSYDRLGELMR